MTPPVVTWFKVYAAVMAVLYVFVTILGIALFFVPEEWMVEMEEDRVAVLIYAVVCTAMGIPLTAIFGAAIFLPPRPWVWIYDIVLIALGFTSCCILPASIALLIFWIKPETKAYFQRV